MKNILMAWLLFFPAILLGQGKDVKKALKGYPKDYVYEVKYTEKNAIAEKKFEQWYLKNKNKYILLGKNTEDCFIRGTTQSCVKGFLFLKEEDLHKYKSLLESRRKEQEKTAAAGSGSAYSSDVDKTDVYILAVGVEEYKNHPRLNLNYPGKDASSLVSKMKQGEGDSRLFWNKVYAKVLTGSNATKANIEGELSRIRRTANENDIIIIYISSHGGCADYYNNSDCNGELYLTPYDYDNNRPKYTSVKVDDIIQGLDCKNCATLIWLDACNSGQAGNDFNNHIDDYIRGRMGQNVNILVAAGENESAQEGPEWEHGAFTRAILDGLNGRADQNSNHIISLRELTEYVIKRVPYMTDNEQHPYNPIKLFPNTQLSTY
jgi:hypothetical protein